MISRELVGSTIAQIKDEIKTYQLDEKYFEKFGDASYDREVLGYIRGGTGYDYMKFLALLTRKLRFQNILELGNYAGASTLCIYAGMEKNPNVKFTTVDVVKDQRYCPARMFADARVNFVIGDVCDLSIYGEQPPFDVDFVFEDTFHYYSHIRDIFEIYRHLLADKALFAIDDINDNDKRKFFDELPYHKWDLTELCHSSGWGLILFERGTPIDREKLLQNAYAAAMRVWKRRFDKASSLLERIEERKPRNILKNFLYSQRNLHSLLLAVKRKLGIIPPDARSLDKQRFYSKTHSEELKYFRKNIINVKNDDE